MKLLLIYVINILKRGIYIFLNAEIDKNAPNLDPPPGLFRAPPHELCLGPPPGLFSGGCNAFPPLGFVAPPLNEEEGGEELNTSSRRSPLRRCTPFKREEEGRGAEINLCAPSL